MSRPPPPPPPTSVSLLESTSESLTVSWTAPEIEITAVNHSEDPPSQVPVYGYTVQYRYNCDGNDTTSDNKDADSATQFMTLYTNLPITQTQVQATNLSDEQGQGFFFRVATSVFTPEVSETAVLQQATASSAAATTTSTDDDGDDDKVGSAGKRELGITGTESRSAWVTHSQPFYLSATSIRTCPTEAQESNVDAAAEEAEPSPPTKTNSRDSTDSLSEAKIEHALHLTYDEHYPSLCNNYCNGRSAMISAAGRPEFREVYMNRFTTATTCYSAPRYVTPVPEGRRQSADAILRSDPSLGVPWNARLATERHLLEMTLQRNTLSQDNDNNATNDNIDSPYKVSVAQYPLPTPPGLPRRRTKKFICVGYSCCRDNSGWEAMVLLDTAHPSQLQQHQQQSDMPNTGDAGTVGGEHSYAGSNNVNTHDDERTVATVDSTSSASYHHNRSSSGGGGGYRRANSGGNTPMASVDDGGASLASSSVASLGSSAPAIIFTGGKGSGGGGLVSRNSGGGIRTSLANLDEDEGVEGPLGYNQQPVARLVLIHREKELHYAKPLDFRPLSPCIASFSCDQAKDNDTKSDGPEGASVGVWIGSADDTKLRLFRAHDTTASLVEVAIVPKQNEGDESPVAFESPIMAIDCLSLPSAMVAEDKTTFSSTDLPVGDDGVEETPEHDILTYRNLLAVACQDGIVRLIGYSHKSHLEVLCREEYTVTIDGPIVNVVLNFKKETGKIEAVIGSLCGYVARFLKDLSVHEFHMDASWEGPYMVAEGFAIGAQEDSILSIHSWADTIAVGTYSGRCLLYGQTSADDKQDYGQPFFDVRLPEPVHGICRIHTEDSSILLLVTTRKTVHLFQEIPKVYDPDMARRILKSLLVRMRQRVSSIQPLNEDGKQRDGIEQSSERAPSTLTT